jgi:phosphatidate cytidylyltransferase
VSDRYDDDLAERRTGGGRLQGVPATGALPLEWSGSEDGRPAPAGDDFEVWTDVLRARPVERSRFTGHPSAAGERAVPAMSAIDMEDDDDEDFAPVLADRRRGRGRGRRRKPRASAAENVSPLRPVEPDGPVGPKGGAEVVTRVVTGVLIAGGCLLALNAGRAPAVGLVAVVVGLGVMELCHALRSHRPAVVIALGGSLALLVGAYRSGEAAFPLVIGVVAVATLLWFLTPLGKGRPVPGVASTFLVFGYVGVLGGFAGLLLHFPNGVGLLLGLAVCSVSYDVCGFFAGSRLGRHKLAPAVSPNKTVEGLVAGMAGSMFFSFLVVGQITPWGHLSALALGAVVAVMAPLGDLCESLLKRDLGVKDLGGLFPGHGGVLDRFDAILFALPTVYYLVKVLDLA